MLVVLVKTRRGVWISSRYITAPATASKRFFLLGEKGATRIDVSIITRQDTANFYHRLDIEHIVTSLDPAIDILLPQIYLIVE